MATSDIEIEEQVIRDLESKVQSLERQLRDSREDLMSRKSILAARLVARSCEGVFGDLKIEGDFRNIQEPEPEIEG